MRKRGGGVQFLFIVKAGQGWGCGRERTLSTRIGMEGRGGCEERRVMSNGAGKKGKSLKKTELSAPHIAHSDSHTQHVLVRN